MKSEFVGIIGGLGGMGALMVQLFEQAGHRVSIADAKLGPIDPKWVANQSVIVVAVPIYITDQVIQQIGPHTNPNGMVMDITSVKDGPVQTMLKTCQGEVVGGHPLFGPSIDTLKGQTFFISQARGQKWLDWLMSTLTDQELNVIKTDPVEHDSLMARVQVLRHALIYTFGLTLSRLGPGPEMDPTVAGPLFTGLVEMLSRQMSQDQALFADLALNNHQTEEVLRVFKESVDDIWSCLDSGNRNKTIELFTQAGQVLSGVSVLKTNHS